MQLNFCAASIESAKELADIAKKNSVEITKISPAPDISMQLFDILGADKEGLKNLIKDLIATGNWTNDISMPKPTDEANTPLLMVYSLDLFDSDVDISKLS